MRLKKACNKVFKELREDEGYYLSWQANIAMSFYDEYGRKKKRNKYLNKKELHKISNDAAKKFLNLLIKK